MKLNRMIRLMTVVLSLSITVHAQDRQPKTPMQRADNQTRWMQKNLGITNAQSEKVHDIILYYATENDKAKADPPGRDKKMEKQGIRKGREQELKEVLTADQYEKYLAHLQQMKERRQEKRGAYMQGDY